MLTALSLLALVAGLAFLEVGADRFTASLGRIAHRLRASETAVGLLTAGGEWEELVVVVLALLGGHPGLAVGNVIGSCLANLLGSLPLGFLGRKPLVLDRSARIYGVVMLVVTILAAAILATGRVEPAAGGLLVGVFVVYLTSVLLVIQRGWLRPLEDDDDNDEDAQDEQASHPGLLSLVGTLLLGFGIISVGAELVVEGAVRLSQGLGLSDYTIGSTVVAIGTTLPDKAISFVAGRRGQGGIVAANAAGSNIFLLTLVLGVAALTSTPALPVSSQVVQVDVPLLLAASALVVGLFFQASLHRRIGVFLLALYLGYVVHALIRGS